MVFNKSKFILQGCLIIFNIQLAKAQLYVDGTTVLIQKNATLYINGDFETDKNGAVNPKVANWGTINVTGNTDFHSTTVYHGQGEVELTGSSKQMLNSNSIPLKKLKIDNSSNVELNSNFTLEGDLTLTEGFILLGNNDLNLDDSVSISGGNSSSYIRVNGTGKVKANIGSTPRLLPVGRNPYLPIILDDGGGREYTVGISEGVYANPVTETGQQTSNVVGETWTIQSSGAQSGVSVTLQWDASEEETGFVRSSSFLSFWENGVSSNWDNGSSMSASGSGPYTLTRTVNFSNNLFYFGIGSSGSALPVEFTYFDAKWNVISESVLLNWQTAMEENNSHFEVQRSFDGQVWEMVGTVQGQGSTFETTNYQFVDESIESKVQSLMSSGQQTLDHGPETVYYRLKQIDYDGAFEYSEIRTLSLSERSQSQNSFSVWPNPSTGAIIKLSKIDNYILTSTNGIVLQKVDATDQINVSNLAFGTYIITSSKGKSVLYIRN